jgi:PAS domain S-box-containing protein
LAEAARRESETRFCELAELLPQTVFELDGGGFFAFANRCALETFGYGQDEIGRLHVSEVFASEERERIQANLCKRPTPESFDDYEYVARRRDGHTFPVLLFSSPILRNGETVGVRGIVVDISSRKEWEQALRTSERRYRLLIETAQDGICVFDALGRLVESNESFCQICGYSPQELRGMMISDLDTLESPEQVRFHIGCICKSGTDRFETKHRRKDGTLVDVEVAATLLDPRESRFVMFVRDITKQKRIEARIKEREATLFHAARLSTLGEMTTGIAHELNQPLSATLSYGDACLCLAQAQTPDIPRITRNLGEIVSQGERAGVIIRRMRALAKGRQPSFSCTDLNDTVRNAVTLVRWELAQNEMKLNLELAESLPFVHADAIQIEQVLLNLMRNAIDAMRRVTEEPRLLTLRTKVPDGDHVCVEVCDTGVGLPQTQGERIFEPFFTTKPDGLGIGLSISRTIIEAHKGILEAKPNTDRGAVFYFSLPVRYTPGR